MINLRAIRKEFAAAAWQSPAQQAEFAERAAPLRSELVKLIPLLHAEKDLSLAQRKARLEAFTRIVERVGDQSFFAAMFKAALDGDDALRRVLLPLLKKCNDANQHERVVREMKTGNGPVRRFCAAFLKRGGGRTALRVLTETLGQSGWGDRREAMDITMDLGGHHAIPAIGQVVVGGSTEERLHALALLGNAKYVKAAPAAARDAIAPALEVGNLAVLTAAIRAYGAVAPADVFFDVAGPYLRSRDRRVQRAALGCMEAFPGPRTVEELSRIWRLGDVDVRQTVLGVLRSIGDEDVLPLMVEALGDQALAIRNAALEAVIELGRSRRVDTTRMLLWLLRTPDVRVRRLAVDIAREVGDPLRQLWPRLLELLRDEDWWVREQVVEALVELAGDELTRHIVSYLEDEDDVVRRYAVEVLMRLKDPRSLGALVRTAASDEDWWVRERAVECAGLIGDAKVLPHLVKLAESDPTLIPSVLTAIRSLALPEGLAFVARVLRHDDHDLRWDALKAAEELGDGRFEKYVQPLTQDPNARVRHEARRLLASWEARFAQDDDDAAIATRLKGLERMLWWMTKKGGDDLFIVAGRAPLMKHLGELKPVSERVLTPEEVQAIVRSVLTASQIVQFEGGDDVDCSVAIKSLGLRFRANVYRQSTGWAAVFRRIRQEQWNIDDLGLPTLVKSLCDLPHGLVLVGGPTGSGKSTTLAAMIKHINTNYGKHIITIEDPIEVVHATDRSLVTQREVGTHTNSFGQALRSTLREDPDVILVGEMRDHATISFALTAAETGHLVLATLHTVSADASMDRLIDAFPAVQQQQVRAMLSQSLRAVICQQLLRRTDEDGGRIVASEILINSDAVANTIRKGRCYQIPSIITTSREMGMQSMDDDLKRLLDAGIIDPYEAYLKARDKKLFEALLASSGSDPRVDPVHEGPALAEGARPPVRPPPPTPIHEPPRAAVSRAPAAHRAPPPQQAPRSHQGDAPWLDES